MLCANTFWSTFVGWFWEMLIPLLLPLGQSLSGELIIVLILTTILPFPNSLTYSRMARNIYPALYAPGIPTVALLGGGRTCCRKS